VWVFVRSHTAKLDALHRCRRWCAPLRLLRGRLWLRLLLLLLQRREHIVGWGWRVALLLCEYLRHLSVDVWVARIESTQVVPHCGHFVFQKLVVFLCPTRVVSFRPESSVLSPGSLMRSAEVSDVLDSYGVLAQ
jgi:hypothetical protein